LSAENKYNLQIPAIIKVPMWAMVNILAVILWVPLRSFLQIIALHNSKKLFIAYKQFSLFKCIQFPLGVILENTEKEEKYKCICGECCKQYDKHAIQKSLAQGSALCACGMCEVRVDYDNGKFTHKHTERIFWGTSKLVRKYTHTDMKKSDMINVALFPVFHYLMFSYLHHSVINYGAAYEYSWTYLFLILGPFCLFMTCCQCYIRSVTDLNGYLLKVAENAEQKLKDGREQCAKARGWYSVCELWEKGMTKKFEEKISELNSIEERMKATPVYNRDKKYMNKFKSERVKRKYEQKKNLKFKRVLDTVKENIESIKIDSKKLRELEENNQQQKLQIRSQEEKVSGLKISIEESKKKISSLRDENASQAYVQTLRYKNVT